MNLKQMFLKIFGGQGNKHYYKYIVLAVALVALAGAGVAIANSLATITDYFSITTKISASTNITVAGGFATLSSASSWTCGNNVVDSRDGKTYTTILIGAQCWMRQNINVGTYVTGATTQGTACSLSDGTDIQKYCYGNDTNNCTTYGGLYQWNQTMCGGTALGAKGICMAGWHVPTHDEYTTLERNVCTSGSCATDFPFGTSTTGWRGTNEGTNLKTVDSSHFSGLLTGYRGTEGSFDNVGVGTHLWSSLQSSGSAWTRFLYSGLASVGRGTYDKAYGFSVRCLKD